MADQNSVVPTGADAQAAAQPELAPVTMEAQSAAEEESAGQAVQTSFWQHPFVQNVLPFLTSLILHGGIIIIGLVTYKAVQNVVAVVKEQIIIPDATMVEGAEVGGIPHPELGADPNQAQNTSIMEQVQSDTNKWQDKPNQAMAAMGGEAPDAKDAAVIGTGGVGAFSRKTNAGEGGPLNPFGVASSGKGGPRASFMGVSGNATRIAYVCDGSGSMLAKSDRLKRQLQESIDGLKPIQSFMVVFFQRDQASASDKELVPANPANKRKAYEFLERIDFSGETNPLPALKAAFESGAQLIYVLTDGDFSGPGGNDTVIKYIQDRNRNKTAKVNTIAFIDKKDKAEMSQDFLNILNKLATDNGGRFSVVSADD